MRTLFNSIYRMVLRAYTCAYIRALEIHHADLTEAMLNASDGRSYTSLYAARVKTREKLAVVRAIYESTKSKTGGIA